MSTEFASRPEFRIALVFVLVSALVFVAVAPFAKTPLLQVPAFIPIYVSALVISDLITAVLLFGQFNFLRSAPLLVLASGYLFTAAMTTLYAIIFPGFFTPGGLLGAGPQTSSAMYMGWHAGFPLIVILYVALKSRASADQPGRRPYRAILLSIAAVATVTIALTVLATAGHGLLPTFLDGNKTTPTGRLFLAGIWALSLVALVALWLRRPRTVVDLWLMVVMCVWLFDIALSALLNAGRYDVGWYFGRIYGLLAAGTLLAVLLIENGKHYSRLFHMSEKLGDANESLEQLSLHDGLTTLANRRFFDSYLGGQIAVARRHRRPVALILCDIDCFKAFNDLYGHQAGDECLRQVAIALRSCCRRPADMAARYGGEEFALILPDTDLAGAVFIAEAARQAVAQLRLSHAGSVTGAYVSISGGVAALADANETAEQLILAADQTLFQAKDFGRNRMVAAGSIPAMARSATG